MVVVVAADYPQFKALMPMFGSPGSASLHLFARDGVTVGTGFHVLAMDEGQQMVLRWMGTQMPASFAIDFPKTLYVRDFTVV